MKTFYSLLIFFLFCIKSYACDCNTPSFVEEFTTSDYVFEGIVTSKVYSKDFLTYKITFEIYKHYKDGDKPKKLSFVLTSESKYQKIITSCDWSVNLHEKWLVYTNKSTKGELYFSKYCSNSQLIQKALSSGYQRMLDNGKFLKVDDFIYNNEFRTNFSSSRPNIDSVFINGFNKEYKDRKYVGLYLLIDSKGNFKSANYQPQMLLVYDTIFRLQTGIKIDDTVKLTEFQQDAINLVSKVKKWEIRRHPISNIPFSYFQYIRIEYDSIEKKWKYELR